MLTIFFALISLSNAEYFRTQPIPESFQFRGHVDYTLTEKNYPLDGGSSVELQGGQGRFQRTLFTGEAGYAFNEELRAWVGVNGGQSTARVLTGSIVGLGLNVAENRNNSGVNEGYGGAQYWLKQSDVFIVPQVEVIYPFWRPDRLSNDPLLGEGAIQVKGGGWVVFQANQFTPFGYGGFAYRDEGRSILFNYDLGTRFTFPGNKWWVQADLRGFESVTDDADSGFAGRSLRDVALYKNGGSFEFYSVNPGRHEVALQAGMNVNKIGLYGGGWMSYYGHSSADTWGAMFGFVFETGAGQKAKRPSYQFTEPADHYDEKVFEEPVVPDYNEPIDESGTGTKKKPVKKKANGEEKMPNVDMLMKDTQKTLEKRGR